METQEITGQVFITLNVIRVNDLPSPDDFIALEVFPDVQEGSRAVTLMRAHGLEPSIGRMDRITFEGQLPEATATAPMRLMVIRWDLPGHPGEAEMEDHMDHLGVPVGEDAGWAYV